jgi:pyruvate,water dikinase
MIPPPYVLAFDDPACASTARVGGKASRLAELTQAEFHVPPGFAVTSQAFADFCAANNLDPAGASSAVATRIREGRLPARLERELAAAVARLGHGSLAVRSSAVAEDGATASMAGQLETYLEVAEEEVGLRLRDCWRSLFQERVAAYATRHGARAGGGMGVVIQRQIRPRYSGVLFSLDPHRCDGDTLLVEWVAGLGEQLVSGEVTPSRARLGRKVPSIKGEVPCDLGPVLLELRQAALRAERLFGEPLDIEWCVDEAGLWVLQARPITSVFRPGVSIWSRSNIGENYPAAVSPFTWSIVDDFRRTYFESLCARLLVPREQVESWRPILANLLGVHGGHVYYNLGNWHRMFALAPGGELLRRFFDRYVDQQVPVPEALGDPESFPEPTDKLLRARVVVGLLRCYATLARRVDGFEQSFAAHRQRWRATLAQPPSATSLADLLADMVQFLERGWGDAALADFSAMVFPALLTGLLARWLGGEEAGRTAGLLRGLQVKSTEPLKLLHALGQQLARDPKRKELLDSANDALLEASLDGEARSLWERFLEAFGGRCYHELLITSPTFEERHDLAWQLVRGYTAPGTPDPLQREAQEAREREDLTTRLRARLPRWQRPLFARVLRDAQRAVAFRERARLCQSLMYGELRRVALAIGQELVRAGRVTHTEDVFYLQKDELIRLARGRFLCPETLPDLIRLRRQAVEACQNQSLPEFFVRETGSDLALEVNRDAEEPRPNRLIGVGVSRGRAVGPARIILDPVVEGARLRRGDILVTRATDPGWTPLFLIAGAVVLERGGMLSHAAIVARELGIPAVVEVEGATHKLADGQRVLVDGDSGRVEALGLE